NEFLLQLADRGRDSTVTLQLEQLGNGLQGDCGQLLAQIHGYPAGYVLGAWTSCRCVDALFADLELLGHRADDVLAGRSPLGVGTAGSSLEFGGGAPGTSRLFELVVTHNG